ncbi:hypothetical protein DFJ74DRAFT_306058 [Hyaloraphidium curvatum]|nr:hypothetical protein DFJ74DRAFT_306058 [Hyaloraphidium curvatum]
MAQLLSTFSDLVSTAAELLADANYLAPLPDGKKPYTYTYDPGDGRPLQFYPVEKQRVPIADVRKLWGLDGGEPLEPRPTLMQDGTELRLGEGWIGEGLTPEDYGNESKVREVYHPRVIELLRRIIEDGGKRKLKKAIIFDSTVRRRETLEVAVADIGKDGKRPAVPQPVARIHGDYTDMSGPRRVRKHVEGEEADKLLAENRWAIINVWRPIVGPVLDAPLALLRKEDAVPARDFVAHDLIYPDLRGETLAVRHHPSHRLIYAPAQKPDEVWVFKTFDCVKGVAGIQVHSGIDEPNQKLAQRAAEIGGRQSIENRVLVFWDDVDTQSKI